MLHLATKQTHRLDPGAEGTCDCIGNFKFAHSRSLLVLDSLSGEAFGYRFVLHPCFDVIEQVHEVRDIAFLLLLWFSAEPLERAWQVQEPGKALDNVFSGDASICQKPYDKFPNGRWLT